MKHFGHELAQHFLEPLDLSPSELARGLGVHRSTVSRLLSGEARLSPMMAARLGAYFDVPAAWWLELQKRYDVDAAARVDVSSVRAMKIPDDKLVGPEGVIALSPRSDPGLKAEPISLSYDELRAPRETPHPSKRRVKRIDFDHGASALVGEVT